MCVCGCTHTHAFLCEIVIDYICTLKPLQKRRGDNGGGGGSGGGSGNGGGDDSGVGDV